MSQRSAKNVCPITRNKCTLLQPDGSAQPVPGEGPERARIVLVGEAPGEHEVARRRPFVGPAGRLLDRALVEVGIDRRECYVTNTCLCRPPGNRAPRIAEVRSCRDRLLEEVRQRAPKVVVLLGNTAARALLGRDVKVGDVHGMVEWSEELRAHLLVTYHPAAALHQGGRDPGTHYVDLVRDLRRVHSVLAGRVVAVVPEVECYPVREQEDFEALLERLGELGGRRVALDVETAGGGRLLCVGLSWRPGTAAVVTEDVLADPGNVRRLDERLARLALVGHNLRLSLEVVKPLSIGEAYGVCPCALW